MLIRFESFDVSPDTQRFTPPRFKKDPIMNTKSLTAAAFFSLASLSAMAQEGFTELPEVSHSSLTRAEVQAEVVQARASGLFTPGDRTVIAEPTGLAKTRAQVVAETLQAIRLGALDRHEHNSFPTPSQVQSIEMAGQQALTTKVAAR